VRLQARVELRRGGFELDVDFELTANITALFGPSGSGKTTLLHAIAGLERPDGGRITFDGQVMFDSGGMIHVRPPERRVGMVFQDLRLFPHLTAEGNLLFGYRLAGKRERQLTPDDVVDALELGGLLARRPDELSGGERQRVALGRTLLSMPRLLLMDEPLAALDARLRRQILPYLRWVHERLSIPIVYVSHSLPEVLELTDQVVVLDRGQVTGQGEVFDVLGKTLHGDEEPFSTASLVPVVAEWIHEDGDFVRGRIGEQEVILPFAKMSPGQPGRVALRPEDVMLAQQPLQHISARNQLHGVVERISFLHGRLLVHLRIAPDAVIRAELTRSAQTDLEVTQGTHFYCVIKTSAFHWH
jgi:molybdate transport system ATP-binding protein